MSNAIGSHRNRTHIDRRMLQEEEQRNVIVEGQIGIDQYRAPNIHLGRKTLGSR